MSKNLVESMLEYRAKHNMSQGAFAERVGVSKQTIYQIENNLQTPSQLTKTKIRLVLREDE